MILYAINAKKMKGYFIHIFRFLSLSCVFSSFVHKKYRTIKTENESFLIYANYTLKFSAAQACGNWIPFSSFSSPCGFYFVLFFTQPNDVTLFDVSTFSMWKWIRKKRRRNDNWHRPVIFFFFANQNIQLTALTFTQSEWPAASTSFFLSLV